MRKVYEEKHKNLSKSKVTRKKLVYQQTSNPEVIENHALVLEPERITYASKLEGQIFLFMVQMG